MRKSEEEKVMFFKVAVVEELNHATLLAHLA